MKEEYLKVFKALKVLLFLSNTGFLKTHLLLHIVISIFILSQFKIRARTILGERINLLGYKELNGPE